MARPLLTVLGENACPVLSGSDVQNTSASRPEPITATENGPLLLKYSAAARLAATSKLIGTTSCKVCLNIGCPSCSTAPEVNLVPQRRLLSLSCRAGRR